MRLTGEHEQEVSAQALERLPQGVAAARRAATRWSRTASGWALNLDGSDATGGLTLPRVEVQATPRGWQSACFLADGRQTPWTLPFPGGVAATLAEALARAHRLLPAHGFFTSEAPPA